jgi:RimJ/RimL family protein N-acetyltransferase
MLKTVREATFADVEAIIDYFLMSTPEFLRGRGIDPKKLPLKQDWCEKLQYNMTLPYEEKQLFYLIWQINGVAVGHSHISDIVFAKEAYMHLHLWKDEFRRQGNGAFFVRHSLPYYFENFALQRLFCQPYSYNEGPNKTLSKVGFRLLNQHRPVPFGIHYEQDMNLWTIEKKDLSYFNRNEI